MKKNLSILIYSLAGGGAERVVSILLHELKNEYNITLVLMRNKIDYDIPKDTKIYFLEDSNPYEHGIRKLLKLPILGLKYKNFCQKNSIDISLAFLNRPSYISLFAKIFGNTIPTLISERTTPSMMYRENNILSKVNKNLIASLYPKADKILCNAEGNRIDLIHNFGIDNNKIVTLYNPFDLKNIVKKSEEFVSNIKFDRFTFVTAGRLDEGKNHKLMIDAFSKLKNINTQLLILGEGILRNELKKQIGTLNLKDRVFLLGFDNNPYKYFAKSDIFLFTSSYEGFPNVLVEALACGLPILSTDCKSGPREILAPNLNIFLQCEKNIEIGEFGMLSPMDDTKLYGYAIDRLMDDTTLFNQYRWKAKQRAKIFSKDLIMKEYITFLSTIKTGIPIKV